MAEAEPLHCGDQVGITDDQWTAALGFGSKLPVLNALESLEFAPPLTYPPCQY